MVFVSSCQSPTSSDPDIISKQDVEILIGTFRGNEERNFYGWGEPSGLNIIWKFYLGEGETVISRKLGSRTWTGAGWTGQPLLVREGSDTFLIQGAYDHNIRKLNAVTGEEIWKYSFDDVVKGTGTLWINHNSAEPENSIMLFQGSRLGLGNYLDSDHIPCFRAISYFTGKELWRLDVKWTDSYSRDADGSGLVISDTLYMALENSLLTVIDPDPGKAAIKDSMLQPQIIRELVLYTEEDVIAHKNNVVTESSPARLRDHLYIASGAGHVYGYNLKTGEIDWDFYIGSDIDGSVVVTSDSCLLVPVEKQYIQGQGGVFKLNPEKDPAHSVIWYFPVEDTLFESWEGGVISTPGINDMYIMPEKPKLAAITALDGFVYIIRHDVTDTANTAKGPDGITDYPIPALVAKLETGPSISSPVITDNRIITAGYNGIFLYSYDDSCNFTLIGKYASAFEASPVIWDNRIYIASRDGFLYCFGIK
jgi:outer membrane protein assembly factor BamB